MQKLPPEALFSALRSRSITHFFGVPDLVLKNFCACVASHAKPSEHIIAANEGSAVAMAAGHQLATGRIPAVYAASSGLPNALGPLLTLTHAEVHSIPMLLVVGSQSSTGADGGHPHATAERHAGDVLRSAEIRSRSSRATAVT
ncbi:hypothetical protein, unlikely [Trypanosoma congolense IL3000]|uniref:Thiamine pyrophosphate enzyme N-terminal TPP-binding domain-containing protein n=1 Tax=Trypanosoma congolense (strain IL3000) TaxID=1068625 RepID=F9W622_TRYCI|nr:hypothetical protein, unlikely [Trypanosoma congolense IL3000]